MSKYHSSLTIIRYIARKHEDYHYISAIIPESSSHDLPAAKDNPMLYIVECSFADPASETEWNDFYSREKLPALISVTGFHTSQRFRAISEGCPSYLALHSISGPGVLSGEEYRRKGGGNFALWQQHVTDWHRNLYEGVDIAPAVGADELLALTANGPEPLFGMGCAPQAMQAIALEMFPEHRWLAVVPRPNANLMDMSIKSVHFYTPMTMRLVK